MKKLTILAAALLSTNVAYAEGTSWGYSEHNGSENWAALSADNFACTGKNQSPVNLTGFIEADLSPIAFDYKQAGHEVINNGHTIQVNFKEGSSIKLDGHQFNLLQVHFHEPSENHINGKSYPLEAHLVHADEQGNLAVVAVMYELGDATHEGIKAIWSAMPEKAGETQKLATMMDVSDIIPKNRDYYRFNGSLTTPPCSEGVQWLVMKDSVTVGQQQIDAFVNILHEPNNRPIQAINSRAILE